MAGHHVAGGIIAIGNLASLKEPVGGIIGELLAACIT